MRKVAIFGGSFDPIHAAHIKMAQVLADALALDEVLFIPTYIPPHKIRADMAPAAHRLEMCRIAAAVDKRFAVSDIEVQRKGASFTVDTLRELRETHPDTEWYLLIGADMFMTFNMWYKYEEIVSMATVCTVPRADVTAQMLQAHADTLPTLKDKVYIAPEAVGNISSTAIRDRLAAGVSVDEWLPAGVEGYIRQHGLYTYAPCHDLCASEEQFREIIRVRESDYRYHHSLEVAKSAEYLAKRYGADPDKARIAGLLHDITKDVLATEQLQILKGFDILLDDTEQNAPKLWHAITGAAFLQRVLHIEDEDLLRAVRYHTTARAGMSLLEKVVYIADFISADRTYPDVDVMRKRADESLESAMEYALLYTVSDLTKKGAAVHPDTLAALAEIMNGGDAIGDEKR